MPDAAPKTLSEALVALQAQLPRIPKTDEAQVGTRTYRADLGPVTGMCLDGRACRRRQAGLEPVNPDPDDRPRPILLTGCTCGGIGTTGSHSHGCPWGAR